MDFVPLHPNCIPESLYLHYPLCKHHCSYCDFNVVASRNQPLDYEKHWTNTVDRQLKEWFGPNKGLLKTLYLGGGTPSLMSDQALKDLRAVLERYFNWGVVEWTIECNPETLTREKLLAMAAFGINRLSLGVQTFIPDQLRRLERLATHEHIEKILVDVQKLFKNFSVDLMIGIPDQTLESLEQDLAKINKLQPPHISVYLLTLDSEHKMKTKVSMAPRIADDQLASTMYERVCEFLSDLGYEHYEVSNFAKPGFRSLHNSTYWNSTKFYLGIGPGAHGYLNLNDQKIRYENMRDLAQWSADNIGFKTYEILDAGQQRIEDLYLKLRTKQPVKVDELNWAFADKCKHNGLLEIHDEEVTLTTKGWLIIESLAARLIA